MYLKNNSIGVMDVEEFNWKVETLPQTVIIIPLICTKCNTEWV